MGKVGVHISKETGGAYADTREVIEDEMERIRCDYAAYGHETERPRLEREVVEAAKAELAVWEGFHTQGWTAASASARNKLRKATRALIDFESQQSK